jgi:hypothetical protein
MYHVRIHISISTPPRDPVFTHVRTRASVARRFPERGPYVNV